MVLILAIMTPRADVRYWALAVGRRRTATPQEHHTSQYKPEAGGECMKVETGWVVSPEP